MSFITIKGKKLKKGQWLHFPDAHDMLIDSVEDTRDGQILVRCGYREGDDYATMFFEPEQRTFILRSASCLVSS